MIRGLSLLARASAARRVAGSRAADFASLAACGPFQTSGVLRAAASPAPAAATPVASGATAPPADAAAAAGPTAGGDPGRDDPRLDVADRKPEAEIARTFAYYDTLVWHFQTEKRIMWKRIERLQSEPRALVHVANRFSVAQALAPALFDHMEPHLLAGLEKLSPAHLATLAWSYAVQSKGSAAFWTALEARATAAGAGAFSAAQKTNLRTALAASGRPALAGF